MSDPVSSTMRARILAELDDIETNEGVRILLAVESGSRAWGFHSPDSDYDVRFVYARPLDWHYRLGPKRDVIERPVDAVLDVSGWELSKALELALRSNAVIAEWLQSPIRYRGDAGAVAALRDFAGRALDRAAVTWHYLSLANRQLERLRGPDGGVRLKRYFYVLRPVLALRWMRLNDRSMPPMDMAALRAGCALDAGQSAALDDLTRRKMAVSEQGETGSPDPMLDALTEAELRAARAWLDGSRRDKPPGLWNEASALHLSLSRPGT